MDPNSDQSVPESLIKSICPSQIQFFSMGISRCETCFKDLLLPKTVKLIKWIYHHWNQNGWFPYKLTLISEILILVLETFLSQSLYIWNNFYKNVPVWRSGKVIRLEFPLNRADWVRSTVRALFILSLWWLISNEWVIIYTQREFEVGDSRDDPIASDIDFKKENGSGMNYP